MALLDQMLTELHEDTTLRQVSLPHLGARSDFSCPVIVRDPTEFDRLIGRYYDHHHCQCVSLGGQLVAGVATSRAKEILERAYHRQGGLVGATQDGMRGTNGGMSRVLDEISRRLQEEAMEHYFRDVFDRYVQRTEHQEKVEIVRQLLIKLRTHGHAEIDPDQPEQYAHNYEPLIRAFAESGTQMSATLRNY